MWILLRTGTNPKRITYPCQQAASPLAATWIVAVIALFSGSLLLKRFAKCTAGLIMIAGAIWLTGVLPGIPSAMNNSFDPLPVWEVDDPVSTVFVMDEIPRTSGSLAAGDSTVPDAYLSDPAIDTLFTMMEEKDIYLHRTVAQPTGIVGADNIVIIKGNFQWTSRNTTSTDRVKGLIWQILQHPDGFSGEIIVCDNTQNIGTGINQSDNNSDDEDQSIPDVVNTFYAKGYPVYYLDWRYLWSTVADEYSEGDYSEGYVYEDSTKITYPKFQTLGSGYLVSLRYGIWEPLSEEYDADRLCIIDFPVLKSHGWAGATIAVKNWIGMLTTAYSYERFGNFNIMHEDYFFGEYALVARVMEATFPRLSIVDAAWTTMDGPVNLAQVASTNMLLASTDPCAVSWYSAKYMLTPIAVYPNNTDPDLPGSDYRVNLEAWTDYLRNAGFACTKDSSEISVYDRGILDPSSVGENIGVKLPKAFRLHQNYPNPFNPSTTIEFSLEQSASLKLAIYDLRGRLVRSLADSEIWQAGHHSLAWDGTDKSGRAVPSGLYLYRLDNGKHNETRKMLLLK
jgi:hypothetical protein